MPIIYAIGEALLDIIITDRGTVSAIPGGAMLNTAVSLGRCDVPISFIGEVGDDRIGGRIERYLAGNGVDTAHLVRYTNHKSTIAIAELDRAGDARYSFYKDMPEERMPDPLPVPQAGDLVLFGSFFALTAAVRAPLINFLHNARNNGALLIYDPNFRRPHLPELPRILSLVAENLSFAQIVRGSDEDFRLLFGADTGEAAWDIVRRHGAQVLFYTRSDRDAVMISAQHRIILPIPPVAVISTVGAGDSFNAGILRTLYGAVVHADRLGAVDSVVWEAALRTGIAFGSHVCAHTENTVTVEFAHAFR